MSDNEHAVAMTTHSLIVSVGDLVSFATHPDTTSLVARDYRDISDAHQQLGRLLSRVKRVKEAHE